MSDSIFSFTTELLSNESFIRLNKKIIKSIGICETILLTELMSKYKYFADRNMLQDGWFFNTIENIENDTTLSEYQQRKITNKLVDMGILQFKLHGMPAKKYFKFNKNQTEKILKKIINNPEFTQRKAPKETKDLTLKNSGIINKTKSNKTKKEIVINNYNGIENPKEDFSDNSKKENPLGNRRKGTKELYAIKLIQIWSAFDHTVDHESNKIDPKTKNLTKTYQKMIKNFIALQKGTFASGKVFDSEWIEKKEIPKLLFTKAWTFPELKEGLIEASKYSLEGYWPPDNKKYNKKNYGSLSYILYNDFGTSKRSWLLDAIQNSVKRLEEALVEIPLESTVLKLIKNPIWPKNYEFNKYKLGKGLMELKEYSDNLVRDDYNKSHQYFGTLALLLKEYLAWIDEDAQNWIEINESIIGVNNGVFKKFIEFQEKEIGIKIKSKRWK